MDPIKLGKKNGCCGTTPLSNEADPSYYPTLYLDVPKKLDLPEEGVITLRYKMVRDTTHLKDKPRSSVELDIHEILSVKGDTVKKINSDSEDALDKYAEEADDEGND